MAVTEEGEDKPGLHGLMIRYATDAAARIDETSDYLRLAKEAYEQSAAAGKKGQWAKMNRLRGHGTEFLDKAEEVWRNDNS